MKHILRTIGFLVISVSMLGVACNADNGSEEKSTATEQEQTEETDPSKDWPAGYSVGDRALEFELPSTTGERVSFAKYPDAKGFIVIFTCNHCPYAKAYESRIMGLDEKYAALGYPVIAISPNDPEIVEEDGIEQMRERAEEKGYTFPYLLDEDQDVYPVYGATKTPHVYVVERSDEGHIVRYIGAIDDNYQDESAVTVHYVADAVDALLAGEEITTTTSRAIGCSIKDKRKKK